MKQPGSIIPKGEDLRKALHWLIDEDRWDEKAIEQASVRFDLSPLDENFLLQHFRHIANNDISSGRKSIS